MDALWMLCGPPPTSYHSLQGLMDIYIYIYIYTSRDPPIPIGGARKRVLNKTVNDRKGGTTNLNEKFEQEIRTRNAIRKLEQEIRSKPTKADQDLPKPAAADRSGPKPTKADHSWRKLTKAELRAHLRSHILFEFRWVLITHGSKFGSNFDVIWLHMAIWNKIWIDIRPTLGIEILIEIWGNFH